MLANYTKRTRIFAMKSWISPMGPMGPRHLDAVVIHRHAGPGVAVHPRRLQVGFPERLPPGDGTTVAGAPVR